jgi:hypothetical protein
MPYYMCGAFLCIVTVTGTGLGWEGKARYHFLEKSRLGFGHSVLHDMAFSGWDVHM